MSVDVVQLAQQLVAIPSVNPMGQARTGPEFLEGRMTQFLEELFRTWGVEHFRQEVEPGRENIVAWVPGDPQPAPVLLYEVHQDTVPVDGMTIPPWGAQVREGRLYGRGAADVKGTMAAMLSALHQTHTQRPSPRPTLVVACTVNEEFGYTGAQKLCHLWQQRREPFSAAPQACVVAEPTQLHVVVAHKGALRWKCIVHGKAAHTCNPDLGRNAIFAMAPVLLALERYHREVLRQRPPHRWCGRPSLSVGIIQGGVAVNTVPDRCEIQVDRRLVPGETAQQALDDLLQYLSRQEDVDMEHLEHEHSLFTGDPLEEGPNLPLAQALLQVCRQVVPDRDLAGVSYGTDAAVIAKTGVPCVVFGPGSIDQAHTQDEWISLDQLRQGAEILFRFVQQYCTLTAAGASASG